VARLLKALTAIAALAVLASAVTAGGEGAGVAVRVVDRTFACTLYRPPGGAGDLDVSVTTELNDPRSGWRGPAHIELQSGADLLDNNLVYVRAKAGTPFGGRTFPPGAFANTKRCTASRATVPLSPKGLPGPPVRWSTGTECRVRGRALVRVRAVLRSPALWRPFQSPYAGVRTEVVAATMAVRGERGRAPVVFAELSRAGGMRFFSSGACT
jgi:hypothetical protein